MTREIEEAYKQWQFTRGNTVALIKQLGDEGLKTELPRKGLDTFCKHFEEMIAVQTTCIQAIETGVMSFDCCKESDDDYEGLSTVKELLQDMEKADKQMMEVISSKDENSQVDWWGTPTTVVGQIIWQISHETFHFGQLIAFAHVLDIKPPEKVISSWLLSGFEN